MLEAKWLDPVSTSSLLYSTFRSRMRRLCAWRWGLSWRRAMQKAQSTRTREWLIADFKRMVQDKVEMYNIPLANIYNFDQTNRYYSLESKYTLTKRGSRTVAVRGSGSTSRCTLMLGASMVDENSPYIVLKGQTNSRIAAELRTSDVNGYPEGVLLCQQVHAWFDEADMLDWIENWWKKYVVKKDDEVYYLFLDSLSVHLTATIRQAFVDCNTEIEYVPEGYTSSLQMMDVGANNPFKDYIRHEFDDWLIANYKEGKVTRPSRQYVSKWVKVAYDKVTTTTIINAWRRTTGIVQEAVTNDNNNDKEQVEQEVDVRDREAGGDFLVVSRFEVRAVEINEDEDNINDNIELEENGEQDGNILDEEDDYFFHLFLFI